MIKNRQSNRLKNYNYSSEGMYFVTLCTHERWCLFGNIKAGKMILSDAGRVVVQCWDDIPNHFPQTWLDEYIVMPNHVHGILCVGANNHSPLQSTRHPYGTSKTIGSIIRGFKIGVTKWVRQNTDTYVLWQRNYYDHIIRNERDLNRIREYIMNNPAQWGEDENNLLKLQKG